MPELRPKPVQQPGPPLWRSVISPGSFTECGKLGVPILTARLPVARIKERWALYEQGLIAGGHDEATRARLLAQSALWRNVYVAESDAQAEDELAGACLPRRAHHMMHVREAHQSARLHARARDAQLLDRSQASPTTRRFPTCCRPARSTARRSGCASRWPSWREVGVQHLLCQTGFGAMSHEQNIASMRRFGEQVMPAFQPA